MEPCKGTNWKANEGFTDQYGLNRYWFSCAKFYFDGNFNIVELPKEFSLY